MNKEIYKKYRKPPRKNISKKMRERIKTNTNERCGYCGCFLPKRWHVDHIVPYSKDSSKCEMDNFMAACPACNLFKGSFSLEQFRRELKFQVERARKYSVNFRMAEKFGLIQECSDEIVFYFERLQNENKTGS